MCSTVSNDFWGSFECAPVNSFERKFDASVPVIESPSRFSLDSGRRSGVVSVSFFVFDTSFNFSLKGST